MYVDIGGDMVVRSGSILGIFDLDGATRSPKTMEFLRACEAQGTVITVTEDLPKTLLLAEEYGMERVYLTALSPLTLEKRLNA